MFVSNGQNVFATGNYNQYMGGLNQINQMAMANPYMQSTGFSIFRSWNPYTNQVNNMSQGFCFDPYISVQGRQLLSGIQTMYGRYFSA